MKTNMHKQMFYAHLAIYWKDFREVWSEYFLKWEKFPKDRVAFERKASLIQQIPSSLKP